MNKNNALLIFVKNPEPGKVKTRLQPEFSGQDCVRLYKGMVLDLLDNIQSRGDYELFLFFTPVNSESTLKNWLGTDIRAIPQPEGDLGKRMSSAFDWAFGRHYKKTVLIGSDCPTIDRKLLKRAFEQLNHSDVVLGPSRDGGYYLIGLKQSRPEMFEQIHWSSEMVLNETVQKVKQAHLTFERLEEKSDIDTYFDVVELWESLKQKEKTYLPETFAFLVEKFEEQPANFANLRE